MAVEFAPRKVCLGTKFGFALKEQIPPTEVGGYFKSKLRSDLNDPPTSVGGI